MILFTLPPKNKKNGECQPFFYSHIFYFTLEKEQYHIKYLKNYRYNIMGEIYESIT